MEISEKGSRVGLGAYVNQVHERPIKKGSAPPVSEVIERPGQPG